MDNSRLAVDPPTARPPDPAVTVAGQAITFGRAQTVQGGAGYLQLTVSETRSPARAGRSVLSGLCFDRQQKPTQAQGEIMTADYISRDNFGM